MWLCKQVDNTSNYLNLSNNRLNRTPLYIDYYIYLFMDDYKRRAHRRTPVSWLAKRYNKIYSFKIAKTIEMFKHRSVLKPKGVHKFKKYLSYKYKVINSFFKSDYIFGGYNIFLKKKLDIEEIVYLNNSFYMVFESEASSSDNYELIDNIYESEDSEYDEYSIDNFELDSFDPDLKYDTFTFFNTPVII